MTDADHHAMIETVREFHRKAGPDGWCSGCAADWPCLPARLAAALGEAERDASTAGRRPPAGGEEWRERDG